MPVICATSDLHGNLPEVPECDLLLICGDLAASSDPMRQAGWLQSHFAYWLDNVPAAEIVAIAGNHDVVFERAPGLVPRDLRWHYLEDSSVEMFGLKIFGSPWTSFFCDWSFNAPITDGPDEPFLDERFSRIPDDTDILLTHGPAFGFGDQVRNENVGSRALLRHVKRVQPKLHVFGHIHEGYGDYRIGKTVSANVSHCSSGYQPVNRVLRWIA